MKRGFTYILTNKNHNVLYIGVTSDLLSRIYQHRNHHAEGFTKKYNVTKLVYYEEHLTILDAIYREKRLKKWNRAWKIDLINQMNPSWSDLYEVICG